MRGLWLVTLAVFIGAHGLAGFAVAETPPGCGGVGLDETLLPSGLYFHVGEQICYEAWLAINAPKCDMENVEVRFWRPDDTPPNPMNICGSPGGTSIESGLYIAQGAAAIVLGCGAYPALDYTVRAEDIVIVEDIPTVVAYVCITGTQLVGPPSQPGQDAKAIPNFVLAPCIEVTKEACEYSKEGDEITYTICVKNCSDVDIPGTAVTIPTTLYNVVVNDPMFGGDLAGFPSELAPGQEECLDFTYTVTSGDMSPLENTVTATGEDITTFVVTDTATESVTLLDPSLEASVVCQTPSTPGGAPSEFLITIENTGDVDLNITTDKPGDVADFLLPAGDTETFTVFEDCTPPEVCYSIDVTWTIPSEYCDLPNTGTVTARDCCSCCNPCIEISKDACRMSKVGDEILYQFRIENCGDVDLTNITVADTKMGDISSHFPTDLAAGAIVDLEVPYTVVIGDEPGPVLNTATITADGMCGDVPSTVTATSNEVSVTLVHPSITVAKVCLTPEVESGDPCEFEITIANTGDVDLDIVTDEPGIPTFTPLGVGKSYTDTVYFDCVPPETCNEITATWSIPDDEMYCGLTNTGTESARDCCTCGGSYGCTPGYWKNQTECWECYSTSTLICDVFTFPAGDLYAFFCDSDMTLHQALKFGGGQGVVGKARNLMRHGVAALLNSCDSDVPYPIGGPANVIAMVNDALATEDEDEIIAVKNELMGYNELGCSQDAHCRPIDPEDIIVPTPARMAPGDIAPSTDPRGVEEGSIGMLDSASPFEETPREFSVRGVPNPAGTSAAIRYALPMDSKVTVEILDVQGRLVTKLLDQHMPAGSHTVAWQGDGAPAGVYFCRVQCCDGKETISKVIKVQ